LVDDDRGNLPDWGQAVRLGYHRTAAWDEICRTGEFREGGGQLGSGIYLVKSDASWVKAAYPGHDVLLEVGYIGGDIAEWDVDVVESVLRYQEQPGHFDAVKTKHDAGPLNQICYKLDGPHKIKLANFRVRKIQQ
jgi:hypothetical protein